MKYSKSLIPLFSLKVNFGLLNCVDFVNFCLKIAKKLYNCVNILFYLFLYTREKKIYNIKEISDFYKK